MATRFRTISDEDLVRMITEEGKSDMFSLLYDRYSNKVFRKCLSFERDKDAAKDLTQDIFVKLFLQLAKFQARSRFSTWLYSITYNYCVEYIRKKNRMPSQDIDEMQDRVDFEDYDDWGLFNERFDLAKKALDKIHPEDKMILLMKYMDEIPIKEIMSVLEISESAVKMRLARARQRAKEIVDKLSVIDNG